MKCIPLVSAVIPTRNRPRQIMSAVRSALSQMYHNLEVIVVIDGPDTETARALGRVGDARLRIVQLDANVGGSDARNAGVQAACGEWIAFLDDDDEWYSFKLERQVGLLSSLKCADPIISSRFIALTMSGEYVRPSRLLEPSEAISEYLLARRGFTASGDGFIMTTTIVASKSLLCRVPFQSGLKKHQDWDWVLRATSLPGVDVCFCSEALAYCDMRSNASISRSGDWEFSLDWIHRNRDLVTARAYSGFLTTHIAWQASVQRRWGVFGPLLWDAYRHGRLSITDVVRYLGFWFVPSQGLHAVRLLMRSILTTPDKVTRKAY